MQHIKKIMKYLLIVIIVFICWMVINAIRIYNYSDEYFEDESDVAIVLGAGTNNGKISPIYRERVNHSINLYKQGKVDFLIFTGGYGKGQVVSDSEVAKKYAIENGIPESKIFIENESTITLTNLSHAKRIMDSHNFHSALIVTDPLHMKRSVKMARKLKINCLPSPTPTTMYRSKSTKLKSLIYESFFYSLGIIQGYF